MTNSFQLQLFNSNSDDFPKIVRERTGSFIDNMKLPIHRWFRYSAGFSATWVSTLINSLERYITKIIIMPLFGVKYEFESISKTLQELNTLDIDTPGDQFERVEVIVDYNNNDTIRATFQNKNVLADFLRKLES